MRDLEVVAEAIRIEYTEATDKVCIVFEITHPKLKQTIKTDWVDDIEFQILDKKLVREKI